MRIVGLETEYGIADPDRPGANPILMSSRLVSACRDALGGLTARWDYGGEDPLQDQRGMRRERRYATGDLLTDSPEYDEAARGVTLRRRRGSWEDPAHLNAVLPNGARFYVDHAHPEYSGPEVRTARDAVLWDAAGDSVVLEASRRYEEIESERVSLYKNNVDGKGASYGTHENYLIDRDVDFDRLAIALIPHLVTRQVYTGSGRVGLGERGETAGFQMSQRADYIETEVGLETTLRRPIVNTRDEPHALRKRWRRLHLIIGDANCFEVPTLMKLGTTSLLLSAIEAGDERLEELELVEPVGDVRIVSRDLSLTARLALRSGEQATALEIQRALLEIARSYAKDAEDAAIVARWESLLDRLGRDPSEVSREVEWVAKLQLMGRMRAKNASPDGTPMPWDDARLAAMDLQWSRLGDGLAWRLVAAGAAERITTDDEVARAAASAPTDTRARLRGAAVVSRADIVDAAGWSTVVLDRDTRHGNLEVVHLDDPHEASNALLDSLMDG